MKSVLHGIWVVLKFILTSLTYAGKHWQLEVQERQRIMTKSRRRREDA